MWMAFEYIAVVYFYHKYKRLPLTRVSQFEQDREMCGIAEHDIQHLVFIRIQNAFWFVKQ